MRQRPRVTDPRVPSALLIVSLVLSACASGAGTAAKGGQEQQDTSAGQATAAANAGAPQGGDSAPVSELTKKRRQATFKVTYKWTAGVGPQPSETWYSKPPKSRIDHGDTSTDHWLSQFVLPSGVFACETSSGKSTCWRAATSATTVEELSFAALIMAGYEDLLNDPGFKTTREARTIAGQPVSCARAGNVLTLGLADITLCHASNGVPMFFSWKAGTDTFTMEATSFSTTVNDKDLDLLATPQN